MSKYTIGNVAHIIDPYQTASVCLAIEDYLNNGVIPPFDPCLSCEPNYIRTLIAKIQAAEAAGLWPPKEPVDLDEGGYTAGVIPEDEVTKPKRGKASGGK